MAVKQDVVYTPRILRSLEEIKETFGVGERQIKQWVRQGAPIAVEGDGVKTRYSAEAATLQAWRVVESSPDMPGNRS